MEPLPNARSICDSAASRAFDFGARGERGNRVDHEHVDRAGAHQRVANLQRLLARVGLRDDEILDVDPQLLGVDRIERMLGVDEGGDAALLLGLGDHM